MGDAALTNSTSSKCVIIELVDIFILLAQGLKGIFILIQRTVLQGLGKEQRENNEEASRYATVSFALPASPT